MVRDRLMELKEGQDKEQQDGAVTMAVEVTSQQAAMNKFLFEIEEVMEGIRKIEAAVAQVRKNHSEILSSAQNEPELKKELEDLAYDIKRTGARVNQKLKELAPKGEDEEEDYSADMRIRSTQHGQAIRQFTLVMEQYYQVQEEYMDRCRANIRRRLQIIGQEPTEEELDEMLEKKTLKIFAQGIEMEELTLRIEVAEIEQRHQEIMKLENSLRELHDLFVDVAVMVHSQGETIDNIAAHVASAQDYVETARVQTTEALKLQGRARKKKIICGIIVVVVVFILALVIALSV